MVESNPRAVANLRDCKQMLDAGQTTVHAGDVFAWLKASPGEFDIMFADPPFEADVQQKLVDAVVNAHCLAPGGFVYLESAVSASSLVTPSSWAPWREKRIGEVLMRVFRSSTESR